MKIKVQVTAEDIQNGLQSSPNNCPVSLACKRALKTDNYVGVTPAYINYNDRDLHISRSVRKFVTAFDSGGEDAVKPFFFYLDPKRWAK